MRKEIMDTVANMKVAEMRKVAGQYGIKNASKYKRVDLETILVDAMVEKAKREKATTNSKAKKATKVEDEEAVIMASELVEQLKTNEVAIEQLMAQNRKVLIGVMKALHCKRWYRTYDKATMVSKIVEATVA